MVVGLSVEGLMITLGLEGNYSELFNSTGSACFSGDKSGAKEKFM